MELTRHQVFQSRKDISNILGGDTQKGITSSSKLPVVLLFMNEEELYSDYFYPKGSYDYCMYTGIGRLGNQDSVDNNMYHLNIDVLSHNLTGKHLLVFQKQGATYTFIGEYSLLETHQNVQPDADNIMRRVFVFHLKCIADKYVY